MAETVFVVDLGPSRLNAAVVDREGKVLARRKESLELSPLPELLNQLQRIASELARTRLPYRAAGVSLAATAPSDGAPDGAVPRWPKLPLARLLESRLGMPVFALADRHAAVLGETWRGAGRGKEDVIALTLGASVGVGIMSGGRLLRGAHDCSGAASWMTVSEKHGFEARKFGGLEAYVSEGGIVRAAREALRAGFAGGLSELEPEALTLEDVADLARRGNPSCGQIFSRAGKLLGLAVANLISLLDPDVVVVGGSLISVSDRFWNELTHTALSRCHPAVARQVRIRLSGLGEDAPLHGAAYFAWQSVNTAGKTPRKPAAVITKNKPLAKAPALAR